MVMPSIPGAPLLAFTRFHARDRLSLSSTASSRSWFASSCFKARCVPARRHISPCRARRCARGRHVCSSCLVVQPFSDPTPGHLLWRLLTPAPSRRALPRAALCCRWWLLPILRMQRAARRSAWTLVSRCGPIRVCHHQHAPLAVQISPGKNANCRCTSAAFTVGCVPVGFAVMCQLASHPSAFTMRFLSVASHLLHSGFLRTFPRGSALAVGSWLSLLTMSPSRYLHRGLTPHKFAPMLGAHPSFHPTSYGLAPSARG